MKNIYDNGYQLIGTKKDIYNYEEKLKKDMIRVGDDYVVDTCDEILDIIKGYADDTIFYIDYSCGMGFFYETWTKSDKLERGV